MRASSFLMAFGLLVGGAAAQARAEDPPAVSPAKALLAEIEAAKAAKDDAKWVEGLKRVATLYSDADDADKKALAQAGGQALKAKSDEVKTAGLDALVATKDGEAAWKAGLKGELPDAKAESAKPFSIKVLEALPQLHPESAVPTLIGLLHDAKDPVVSARAATALGAYERSKQRLKILDELIKAIRHSMPSGGGRSGKAAGAATPRWTELAPAAGGALNTLTGQEVANITDWLKLYDENKKKPALLFKNELD